MFTMDSHELMRHSRLSDGLLLVFHKFQAQENLLNYHNSWVDLEKLGPLCNLQRKINNNNIEK